MNIRVDAQGRRMMMQVSRFRLVATIATTMFVAVVLFAYWLALSRISLSYLRQRTPRCLYARRFFHAKQLKLEFD